MKFLILLVFSIQIALVSSESPAEKDYKGFAIAVLKSTIAKNFDILHADFESFDSDGVIKKKSDHIKEGIDDEAISYAKEKLKTLLNGGTFDWKKVNVQFTRDGLLYIRNHENDGKLSSVKLAIRDSSIEGGYKMYRYVTV
ncbi:unnamed protein product [Caenorhabditis angaria]|uniref:Uncharacterized protein n=1 Tax=Caenorhabditis angaria TaxID=860376 RepID=A0A9P1MXM6_9PELO|nr:unnamed protein product [Caenorhabditis angaria]